MPFDAMVEAKHRPQVPEFFDTTIPMNEMTEIERLLAMHQITPAKAAQMHFKEGREKWKKEQEAKK
jgi:hypothetical protein